MSNWFDDPFFNFDPFERMDREFGAMQQRFDHMFEDFRPLFPEMDGLMFDRPPLPPFEGDVEGQGAAELKKEREEKKDSRKDEHLVPKKKQEEAKTEVPSKEAEKPQEGKPKEDEKKEVESGAGKFRY
jgi:hypothetical protein